MEVSYETIRNMEVNIENLQLTVNQLIAELQNSKVLKAPKKE